MPTEMKFAIQVPHAMKSMYDESGNWNEICNVISTGHKISDESHNPSEIYDAKQ